MYASILKGTASSSGASSSSNEASGKGRTGRKKWVTFDLSTEDNSKPIQAHQQPAKRGSDAKTSGVKNLEVKSLDAFPTLAGPPAVVSDATNDKGKKVLGPGLPVNIVCPMDHLLRPHEIQLAEAKAAVFQSKPIFEFDGPKVLKLSPIINLPGKSAYAGKAEMIIGSAKLQLTGTKVATPMKGEKDEKDIVVKDDKSISIRDKILTPEGLVHIPSSVLAACKPKKIETSAGAGSVAAMSAKPRPIVRLPTVTFAAYKGKKVETLPPLASVPGISTSPKPSESDTNKGFAIQFGSMDTIYMSSASSNAGSDTATPKNPPLKGKSILAEVQKLFASTSKESPLIAPASKPDEKSSIKASDNIHDGEAKPNAVDADAPPPIAPVVKEFSAKIVLPKENIDKTVVAKKKAAKNEASVAVTQNVKTDLSTLKPSATSEVLPSVVASSSTSLATEDSSSSKEKETSEGTSKKAAKRTKRKAKANKKKEEQEKSKQEKLAKEHETTKLKVKTKASKVKTELEGKEVDTTVKQLESKPNGIKSKGKEAELAQPAVPEVAGPSTSGSSAPKQLSLEQLIEGQQYLCTISRSVTKSCECEDLTYCTASPEEKAIRQRFFDEVDFRLKLANILLAEGSSSTPTADVASGNSSGLVSEVQSGSEAESVGEQHTPETEPVSDQDGADSMAASVHSDKEIEPDHGAPDIMDDQVVAIEEGEPMIVSLSQSREEEPEQSCSDVFNTTDIAKDKDSPVVPVCTESGEAEEAEPPSPDVPGDSTALSEGTDLTTSLPSEPEDAEAPECLRLDVLDNATTAKEGSDPMALVQSQPEEEKGPESPHPDVLNNPTISKDGSDPMAFIWSRSEEEMEQDYPRRTQEANELRKTDEDLAADSPRPSEEITETSKVANEPRVAFSAPLPSKALILYAGPKEEEQDVTASEAQPIISTAAQVQMSMSIPKLVEIGILPKQMPLMTFHVPNRPKVPSPLSQQTFPKNRSKGKSRAVEEPTASRVVSPSKVPITFNANLPYRNAAPGTFRKRAPPQVMTGLETPGSPELTTIEEEEEEEVTELAREEEETGTSAIQAYNPEPFVTHLWPRTAFSTPEEPQSIILCTTPQITARKLICGSDAGSSAACEREYLVVNDKGELVPMEMEEAFENELPAEGLPKPSIQPASSTNKSTEITQDNQASEDVQASVRARNVSGGSSETIVTGIEENFSQDQVERMVQEGEQQASTGEDSDMTMVPTALLKQMMARIQQLGGKVEQLSSKAPAPTPTEPAPLNNLNLVMNSVLDVMCTAAMKEDLSPMGVLEANQELSSRLPRPGTFNEEELRSFSRKSQVISMLAAVLALHVGWLNDAPA